MAGSQTPVPLGSDPGTASARTPGPTGNNDAADPNLNLPAVDTPGPVGVNDLAAVRTGVVPPVPDAAIEALDLGPTARQAAYDLKKQFPSVVFTSGRRDKSGQASAMASNVVLNRNWIQETYVNSVARGACQKWLDDHPDQKTEAEIAAGLKGVLDGLTDAELAALSKHLSGEAFDVQPVEMDAENIKAAIRNLTGLSKFLEMEGGLVRWHAQF